MGQPFGVGNDVDFGDPSGHHGERHDRIRSAAPGGHDARCPVDDRRATVARELGVGEDPCGDRLGTAELPRATARPEIGSDDGIGVEDVEEALEVAISSRRQECRDDLALILQGLPPVMCKRAVRPSDVVCICRPTRS